MNLLGVVLVLQVHSAASPSALVRPVLEFPDVTLDDPVAYTGYQTRFYRDFAGNTVQIYLDKASGRLVHLLADAENESAALTWREPDGKPATLEWGAPDARVSGSKRSRSISYSLTVDAPAVSIGWFMLGSMRVERDFQYAAAHRRPFADPPFVLPELEGLVARLHGLDPDVQKRHLVALNAPTVAALRGRLKPVVTLARRAGGWVTRAVQPSLDARDTLAIEVRVDQRAATAIHRGDSVTLASTGGGPIPVTVTVYTTGRALTPLTREQIFSPEFLRFVSASRRDPGSTSARWIERQVRAVQLLSSREKLMAGLPAYATYFGRDMLVSALMMRPIWRADMSGFVIASVLRKVSPAGDVSHEEALGGQADREAAGEYVQLVDAARAAAGTPKADSLWARAGLVLREHRRVRENYHMIDDEFQLPVLVALWLADSSVTRGAKRAFLLDSTDGEPRLRRMLRELALVARLTAPYAADPVAAKLVSFHPRDSSGWQSASWRDSNAGYAGGRFAMDINAIWAPHALESMATILAALPTLGIRRDSLLGSMPELASGTPLGGFMRDAASLRRAISVWTLASRHFVVALGPAEVRSAARARVAAMPDAERRHWLGILDATRADADSLTFLALSLDRDGRPIAVANSDVATGLFLSRRVDDASSAGLMRDVRLFTRPYPVGLLIDAAGPVVANDAYAPPAVWDRFERDQYHGPRVVWGREVNLFLLGLTSQLEMTRDPARRATLLDALARVRSAVDASGFHSELWSYGIRADGRLGAMRYGTGSDLQLWSTTDLAVRFALARPVR